MYQWVNSNLKLKELTVYKILHEEKTVNLPTVSHLKNNSYNYKRLKICFKYWPTKCQNYPHIETSQLVCTVNQLSGFYMRVTLAFNKLKCNCYNIPFKLTHFMSLTFFDSPWKLCFQGASKDISGTKWVNYSVFSPMVNKYVLLHWGFFHYLSLPG